MQRHGSAGLPTRAALQPSGLFLVLKDIAAADLRDPFMQHTVSRSDGAETIVQIAPGQIGDIEPTAAPAGVIFHVGRCGSTVVSQALKQLDAVVYSEPLPLNELLSPPAGSRAEVTDALRSLGAAFAAHAGKPYVLKLSSWNTLFCDVICDAFPLTPWAFCVRDPVEVCGAILRDPPPWFRGDTPPARHLSAVVDPSAQAASAEAFAARLYGAFCDSVLRVSPLRGQLVQYEQISDALTEIASHFGLRAGEDEARRMRESASLYAKAPPDRPRSFSADSAAKQASASPALREAVAAWARPALDRVLKTLPAI